jgi:hypothetical protein
MVHFKLGYRPIERACQQICRLRIIWMGRFARGCSWCCWVPSSTIVWWNLNLVALPIVVFEIQIQSDQSSVDFIVITMSKVLNHLPDTMKRFSSFVRCSVRHDVYVDSYQLGICPDSDTKLRVLWTSIWATTVWKCCCEYGRLFMNKRKDKQEEYATTSWTLSLDTGMSLRGREYTTKAFFSQWQSP